MKHIIVIGDGMADHPVPKLSGETPLEASKKPFIDALCKNAELGLVQTVPKGLSPGSDTAILSIFGYDPCKYYTGRSPLEAAGLGLLLKEGQVSFRCNMLAISCDEKCFEEQRILSHSGGSIDGASALELMEYLLCNADFSALCKKHGISFKICPSFRHIAVQTGVDTSGLLCAPPHDNLGKTIAGLLPRGSACAGGLIDIMRLSHMLLNGHPANQKRLLQGKLPANCLWFWAQGTAAFLPNFNAQYGTKGFVVSAVPLVHGIAHLAGLDVITVPGATGEIDTNFEGKVSAVLNGLFCEYDFALLHVEAPDECSHNKDLNGKLQAIEWLDSRTIKPIVEGLNRMEEDFCLLFLSDHKTLIANGTHNAEPVPYMLYKSTPTTKSGLAYTENFARQGPYIKDGTKLIKRLLSIQSINLGK